MLAGAVLAAASAHAQVASEACQPDERLAHAAAELLLRGDPKPEAEVLVAAVRAAGSEAVALHALFVEAAAGEAPVRAWLAERRQRSDAALICGSASSERGLLVISSAKAGELSAIDPDKRVVRGALARGFAKAELVIAAADGNLVRVGVSQAALREGVHLDEALPAPLEVQLVATGPSGPRPVAERVVGGPAAAPEPEGTAAKAASSSTERQPANDPAADLAKLILGLRGAEGRGSLRDNRLLREAATKHAHDVCEQGRIAHELAHGQDPPARLAAAGLAAQLVGEAIARARDADSAFEALQRSPSHRLTMLDRRFTDLGVGRASDDAGKICFVVLLAQWPRYVGH